MNLGWRMWLAGTVFTLLCIIFGYFGDKKKSLMLYLQAGILYLSGAFCSYHAILWFLGRK